MSKANVNIEDVASFQNSIQSETETMNDINSKFSEQLSEIDEQIKAEKKKLNTVLDTCQKGINRLTVKIDELKEKLEELEAKLAVTPPVIVTTVTDSEGNSTTIEEPNPEYEALENQIAEVEEKLSQLENLLAMFEQLQMKATHQIALLEQVVTQLQALREEIGSSLHQLEGCSEEAVFKLRNIQQALQEYMNTKIDAPSMGAFSSENPGGFFKNLSNKSQKESGGSAESHDSGSNGYKDNRIEQMYEYVESRYDRREDVEWKEAAYRYKQQLLSDKEKYQKELQGLDYSKDYRRREEIESKIHDINFKLKDIDPFLGDYSSTFVGFKGSSDFDSAYGLFITDRQGNKDTDIKSCCGIVASQNVVNQQLGTKTGELEAINHMRGLSRLNVDGATYFCDREAFVNSYGLVLERKGSRPFKRIGLDEMCTRFEQGESIMLSIFASDISQRELSDRTILIEQENTGKKIRIKDDYANHSVTVAGFTKSDAGKCTGIYLNDTGHHTDSNRVWISLEKFQSMQRRTKEFSVEFCRRK